MQSKADEIELDLPNRASEDIPKTRPCLCCSASFWSDGFGQRICSRCKGSPAWRSAIPEGISQGRRRFGGQSS